MKNGTAFGIAALLGVSGAAIGGTLRDEAHLDTLIEVFNGNLITSAIEENEDPATIIPGVRVFGAELGEPPFGPGQGDEPGFQGYNFPQGVAFTFDITAALGEWNGSAFAGSDDSMTVAASLADPNLPNVTTGAGFVPGFVFTTAGADGRIHQHLEFQVNSAGRGWGVLGAGSIYLLELQVSAPGYGTTPRFWFVFNDGASEEDHEAAIEWVEQNLVPTPGAAGLLALAGITGLRRRR